MRGIGRLAIGLVALFPACDGDVPPGVGQTGEVRVVITDDPATKVATTEPTVFFAHHKSFDGNYFHGRLTGRLQLFISRFGREWQPLGASTPVDLGLQVEGADRELHGLTSVPAGSYAYVRLVAVDAAADLELGALIDGARLDETRLDLGIAGELVAEVRLGTPIEIGAGSVTTLGLDLNAEGWMSAENVAGGSIPATDVETSISLTPRFASPVENRGRPGPELERGA